MTAQQKDWLIQEDAGAFAQRDELCRHWLAHPIRTIADAVWLG
jgi:hypothetical protein